MSETTGVVPTLVAILICDQVIDDRMTNKKSAIGLFNAIVAQALPSQIHQMAVMVTMTEVNGKTPLEVRLVRDSDNQVILQTQGHVESPNPLAMLDLVFNMQGVALQSAGQYAFEVLSSGELLGRRRFSVVMMQPRPQPGQPPPGGSPLFPGGGQ